MGENEEMNETMKVLCNSCKSIRFIVIKPSFDLPESHIYFTCHICIRDNNRNSASKLQYLINSMK